MVYCGKPSKGCQNCRERKIACDQQMPGCRMCEKHNRICPGYRNIVDLMFRDESEHVIWKANKPKARSSKPRSPSPTSGTKRKNKKQGQRRARSTARAPASPALMSDTQSPSLSIDGAGPRSGTRQFGQHLSPPDIKVEWPESPFRTSTFTPTSLDAGYLYPESAVLDYSSDEEDLFLPSSDDGTWPTSPSSAPDYTLSPIFQEQGMAFFFSRYVAAAQENNDHNNYDFIYDIWKPNRNSHGARIDAVLASMTAVGLAAMSTLTCSPERLNWARQSYVTALRLTNDALMNPEEATKDSTLLAVLILGTYEMLVGPDPDMMHAWRRHMKGAAALAILRGPDQFRTKAGVRMFLMLCESLTINCVHEETSMPESLMELRAILKSMCSPLGPNWDKASPLYKILQVRHDMKNGLVQDTQAVVDALLAVDDEYAALVAGMPDDWQYTVVGFEQPTAAVFGRSCHAYPSLEKASSWNNMRMFRLLVHETILAELHGSFRGKKLSAVPMERKVQFVRSWRMLTKLRDAMLAGIPQHFGIVGSCDARRASADAQPDGFGPLTPVSAAVDSAYHIISAPPSTYSASSSPAVSSPSSERSSRLGSPEFLTLFDFFGSAAADVDAEALFLSLTSASHPLVWPLYFLGVSSSCTPTIRAYVVERLTALYVETGLVQARKVAEAVGAREAEALRGVCGVEGMPDVSGEPMPMRI